MSEQSYTRTSDKVLQEHMISEENRLTKIEARLENLENDLKELTTSVKDLVDAWKTAGNLVSFVKWVSGILTAIAVVVAFVKGGFKL